MAYPARFHRLVIYGDFYSDVFNTTLSIVADGGGDMDHVSDTLLASVAAAVSNWWDDAVAGSIRITSAAKLRGIKLNRIGTDGLYVDATTMENVYGSPIAGGGSPATPPPQLSTVATLRTPVERGLASKGRMYLPVTAGFTVLGTDGRATTADALTAAQNVALLITQLNTIYDAPPGVATPGHVAVASKTRGGAFQPVTHVTVGRVVDTMRSRRNKLIEAPQEAPVPFV